METLCVMIATKHVADDVRNSMDERFVQPHRAVPQRRQAPAVLRWANGQGRRRRAGL